MFNSGEARVFGYGVITVGSGAEHERVGDAMVEDFGVVAHGKLPDRLITALEAVRTVGGEE